MFCRRSAAPGTIKQDPANQSLMCVSRKRHSSIRRCNSLVQSDPLTLIATYIPSTGAPYDDLVQHWADRPGAITLEADRGYDAADFVEELRAMNVRP